MFAGDQPYKVLSFVSSLIPVPAGQPPSAVLPFEYRRFGLGESHHESGTLWMGEDPSKSVTDANGRYHFVKNAYEASPAVFPTNAAPVLTGIALGRRLTDHPIPDPVPYSPETGFQPLFSA